MKLFSYPKRALVIVAIVLMCASYIQAQKYSFEDGTLPDGWSIQNGSVSFNKTYSTDGSQSLFIEIAPGATAVLNCPIPVIPVSATSWFNMDVLNFEPTEASLSVAFLSEEGEAQLTGDAVLKFKGWMPYYRKYNSDFASTMSKACNKLQITVDNSTGSSIVKIGFDNFNFAASFSTPNALPIMAKDVAFLKSQSVQLLTLHSSQIAKTSPKADEAQIKSIAALKSTHPLALDPMGTDIAQARTFAESLEVERGADNRITRCKPVTTVYTKDNEKILLQRLNVLASSDDVADKKLFADLMDAVLFTNVLYRYPQLAWNTYDEVRTLPRLMLALVPVCTDEQMAGILDCARWISEAGWGDVAPEYFSQNFNSDIMYLTGGSSYHISAAVYNPDVNKAASDLATLTQLLERMAKPVSGGYEVVKPDGCGYHHGAHYNNYMYAFNPWITTALKLSTTPFAISKSAYEDMKRVVIATYCMSNRSNTGQNWFSKSLAGRHPHAGGQLNQITPGSLENFIGVSTTYFGGQPDPELAAAYNYFLISDKYNVEPKNFSGFYQFNYSPMGIYRSDDWVVTMRCPNTEAWGAEIYSAKNRFGRYQSTGSMEVVYNGNLANSGIPTVTTGYDWNVVPGTTTVHYNTWRDMMPSQNTSRRFDQKSNKDFSGALAWKLKNAGMFSCDFVQNDTHTISGVKCYSASTNLMFKKTIFAIDGMLLNIGSDISAQGTYNVNWITATNLFQEVGEDLTDFQVNGETIGRGTNKRSFSVDDNNLWLVTPKGTGYIVPKGNKEVVVNYDEQAGPNETGATASSPETGIGAKAYIKHGKKPVNDSYSFIMVPGVKSEELASRFAQIIDSFEILSQNDTCHAILYKPDQILAMSFFDSTPDSGLEFVKATGSSMLVMRQVQQDGKLTLAVCDPNLHVKRLSTDLHNWSVSPSQTWLTISGGWDNASSDSKVNVVANADNTTQIYLDLADGLPEYITLSPKTDLSVKEISGNSFKANVRLEGNEIAVALNNAANRQISVDVFNVSGCHIGASKIQVAENACNVKLATESVILIVKISDGLNTELVKLVK